jgi:N-acetyl-gamma-glutamyl-phosphate reductase
VLALPNGHSEAWVGAIERHAPEDLIVDLSADHRFDEHWVYGLPEVQRDRIVRARRIANPGCYATGAQLALYPVLDLLDGPAHVFGVSGYSGAGTTPSPKNDPRVLADNLVPYALSGHGHEHEIRWQLGHKVFFMPHVAPFFSGIVLTVSMPMKQGATKDVLWRRYLEAYQYEPLIEVQEAIPLPRDAAGKHGVTLGGLVFEATDGHAVIVVTLDNLLKGAATQCLQNMNLASGIDELAGLRSLIAR